MLYLFIILDNVLTVTGIIFIFTLNGLIISNSKFFDKIVLIYNIFYDMI